jgi:hypothetical protein
MPDEERDRVIALAVQEHQARQAEGEIMDDIFHDVISSEYKTMYEETIQEIKLEADEITQRRLESTRENMTKESKMKKPTDYKLSHDKLIATTEARAKFDEVLDILMTKFTRARQARTRHYSGEKDTDPTSPMTEEVFLEFSDALDTLGEVPLLLQELHEAARAFLPVTEGIISLNELIMGNIPNRLSNFLQENEPKSVPISKPALYGSAHWIRMIWNIELQFNLTQVTTYADDTTFIPEYQPEVTFPQGSAARREQYQTLGTRATTRLQQAHPCTNCLGESIEAVEQEDEWSDEWSDISSSTEGSE